MQLLSPFIADAGGLPTANGSLARGRLLRVSGDLVSLSGLHALESAGVRSCIDLRGEGEDRARLARWARRSGIEYRSVPIAVAGGRDLVRRIAVGGGAPAMLALYRAIVDGYGRELARAVEVIARGTPVVFGCAAGKDRTGVLAALVQSVVGVRDEDVARSYVASAPPVPAFTEALEALDVPPWLLRLPGTRVVLGAEAPTILGTLAHVRREHGDVKSYLLNHGLPAASVPRLQEVLCA